MKMGNRIVPVLFWVLGMSFFSNSFVGKAEAHCTWRHITNHCFDKWFNSPTGSGNSGSTPAPTPAKGNIAGGVTVFENNPNQRFLYKPSFFQQAPRPSTINLNAIPTGRSVDFAQSTATRFSATTYAFCDGGLCLNGGTYTVNAQAENTSTQFNSHIRGCVSGVPVVAGQTTKQDIELWPYNNCPEVR